MAAVKFPPHCVRGRNGVAIVVIPKVAHGAIKRAVLESYGVRRLPVGGPLHRHKRLRLCEPETAVAEGFRLYAFVRHPFDRLVSCWAQRVLNKRRSFVERIGATAGEPFADFVARLDGDVIRRDRHLMPQTDFVPEAAHLLRFERIEEGWARIREGWPDLPPLRKWNASRREPASQYATPEALARVQALYAEDYGRFGYE